MKGLLCFALAFASACANNVVQDSDGTHEDAYIRSYFYVGGSYVPDGSGGHIYRDQMYVERLRPVHGTVHDVPIVLIHGQAQTGTNFLNKPDGGRGWASEFLQQGYEVYVVDQTFRGRSAWQPSYGAASPSTYSAERIQERFTATASYQLWSQAINHTQWPGSGKMGDAVFDAFYAANVQFIVNATYQQATVREAGAQLLDKIGKEVVLFGHSQGGSMPLLIADARPDLVRALVLLEPIGPPFREAVFGETEARKWGLTDIPVTYDPPVVDPEQDLVRKEFPSRGDGYVKCLLQSDEHTEPRQLVNLAAKPILVVTSEASYHAQYDYCTAEYLKQAGCLRTDHMELEKIGIHGNGHMFFLEKNSHEIQQVIEDWIQQT